MTIKNRGRFVRIDLIRRIKNLDLVRRVLDPEGEMTAFNKQESWWPNRGRLEKNSDALEIPV